MKKPWDMEPEYSKEDHDFLEKTLRELQNMGVRWAQEPDEDGGYSLHIRGLKTWLGKDTERTEKLVVACWRLTRAHRDLLIQMARLRKDLEAVAGTSELADLSKIRDLCFSLRDELKGVMVPTEHAERLVEIINRIARQMKQRGFDEGSDILHRLGTGDMSVTDFEKTKPRDV
jgi:hypothetical protein